MAIIITKLLITARRKMANKVLISMTARFSSLWLVALAGISTVSFVTEGG